MSRVVKYWKRYLLAAAPVALLLAGFVVGVAEFRNGDELTWSDAIYFAVITSTTVGYGDFNFNHSQGHAIALSAYTILVVVVLANSIAELFAIRRRQLLRDEDVCDFGPNPSDLEEMLLDKYAALSPEDERAGAEPALSEADYVVATLVKADIVDDQILFAIRRNFHWDALAGATKFSTMITAEDVHALPKRPSRAQLWVPARLRGQGRGGCISARSALCERTRRGDVTSSLVPSPRPGRCSGPCAQHERRLLTPLLHPLCTLWEVPGST